MTKKLESKHRIELGFFTVIGIVFLTACANGGWGIYTLIDSMNQPLKYHTQVVGTTTTIVIDSPTINWSVLEINISLLIFQVIVFVWVYLHEDLFPIKLRGSR